MRIFHLLDQEEVIHIYHWSMIECFSWFNMSDSSRPPCGYFANVESQRTLSNLDS